MRTTAISALLLVLAACSGPTEDEYTAPKKDKYGRPPNLSAQYKSAVERRYPLRGMHKDEIKVIMRSGPEKVRRGVVHNQAKYTQWVYAKRQIDYYFDDEGFLVFFEGP